jgi:FliI/YscN family ATPase
MIARGRVTAVRQGAIVAAMPELPIGTAVAIATRTGERTGTVVAADGAGVYLRVHGAHDDIACGNAVVEAPIPEPAPGAAALGRALPVRAYREGERPVRAAVSRPLPLGVRAIDALLTIGRGARIGIFGPPGAGKSTLLETIVRGTAADAVVVGLCGERGREARDWEARLDSRTTIVCATSERPPAERVLAAESALVQAAALAGRGLHVLVLLDSLARVAAAMRELAIAAGEPVGRGGYPPSVFAGLASLCERAGAFTSGSVTLIATVLSDGDERDPVSDAARSLLDGHIALSPALAHAGRFPAIDVPASASRTMHEVVTPEHAARARAVRAALAALAATADARALGLQPEDTAVLRALAAEEAIDRLLLQGREPVSYARSLQALGETADILEVPYGYPI